MSRMHTCESARAQRARLNMDAKKPCSRMRANMHVKATGACKAGKACKAWQQARARQARRGDLPALPLGVFAQLVHRVTRELDARRQGVAVEVLLMPHRVRVRACACVCVRVSCVCVGVRVPCVCVQAMSNRNPAHTFLHTGQGRGSPVRMCDM